MLRTPRVAPTMLETRKAPKIAKTVAMTMRKRKTRRKMKMYVELNADFRRNQKTCVLLDLLEQHTDTICAACF